MKYKVTVITPCYNVEETIRRELNSLINQTMDFNDIEVILYDDGSVDNSKKIIKEYCENYENITAIFGSENRGPGFGKNNCLEKATGEFVFFLDADDEFDLEMCDKLYSTAKSDDADIVACGILRHDNYNITKKSLQFDASKSLENTEDKVTFINKNIFYLNDNLTTHCLFKLKIIKENNIKFLETYYAEDIYFKAIYRIHTKKLVYLKNYFGYIHNAYTDSITNNIDLDDLNKIQDVHLKILEEVREYDVDLAYLFQSHIACSLIRLYVLNLIKSPKNEVIDFLKRMREFEIDIKFNHIDNPLINVLNNLILREKYDSAYAYLHVLRTIYNSKILRKTYRLFSKK